MTAIIIRLQASGKQDKLLHALLKIDSDSYSLGRNSVFFTWDIRLKQLKRVGKKVDTVHDAFIQIDHNIYIYIHTHTYVHVIVRSVT